MTYRKRHSYNTRSNKIRVVKTPGASWGQWRCLMQPRNSPIASPISACQLPHTTFRLALPGGRHVAHYVAKKAKPVVCGVTGKPLAGVRLKLCLSCSPLDAAPCRRWLCTGGSRSPSSQLPPQPSPPHRQPRIRWRPLCPGCEGAVSHAAAPQVHCRSCMNPCASQLPHSIMRAFMIEEQRSVKATLRAKAAAAKAKSKSRR